MLKVPKIRSEKHRRFIANLPCSWCFVSGMSQAAHIRTGNGAGMGLKSGDDSCVPLCIICHSKQHATSEAKFYGKHLEAAKQLGKKLFQCTGDNIEGMRLISEWRNWL